MSWFSPTYFRLRQALKAIKKLPAGSRVLEIGCGAGQFIRAIKKIRPEINAFGCDISQSAIEQALKRGGGVEYKPNDESGLPYADDSFEAILIFDVLEHAANPARLLLEVHRVLKKDGTFYCFVPCEGDYLSFWFWLKKIGLGKDLTKKYAGHINYFSRNNLIKAISTNQSFVLISSRYGEHFFGQLMGVISFFLMDRRSKRMGGNQLNNEEYFQNLKKRIGVASRIISGIVNLTINIESVLFSHIPSPNIHLVWKK